MISSEIVIAYTQCRRKAYHLMLSTNKLHTHDYIPIVEKETQKNRTEYLRRIKIMEPEMLTYSPDLLEKEISVLCEANLYFEDLTAYIDVLTKSEEISTPRKPYYIPTLVIGNYKINKEHKLHLAFNAYVLSAFQKDNPSIGIIIDRKQRKHTISISQLYKEIAQIIDKLRGWVLDQKQEIPSAILNRHCPYCFFQHECESEAEKQDHLSLLRGMREKEVIDWNKKGIFTVTQLSYTYRPRRRKKGKKFRSRYYHSLKALAIREKRIYIAKKCTIPEATTHVFNIQVSLSEMFYFKRKLAEKYMIAYEEIRQSLVSGDLLHVDETEAKIRHTGEGYVWVFTNMTSVLYMFRPTRESDFLKEYLKDFTGVLVSDFYAGYDSLPCPQQKCLVHLIRDLNQDLFKNQLDVEYKRIVVHFGCLLKAIIETIDTYGLKRRHLQKYKKDVDAFYNRILTQEYTSELAIAYQNRFKKTQGKLFTFLDYDGIPWNNNNAEHAIKPFARYRRKVNKSYTERSLGFYLILLSIQQTCKYRGINFFDFLKSGEKSIENYSIRY